jgi:Mn-dependent DtxR family transcriptional regulator
MNGLDGSQHTVLFVLFDLASSDVHATVLRVAERSGLSRPEVDGALADLDAAGLVDRERVRLTMAGLAAIAFLGRPRLRRPAASTQRAA